MRWFTCLQTVTYEYANEAWRMCLLYIKIYKIRRADLNEFGNWLQQTLKLTSSRPLQMSSLIAGNDSLPWWNSTTARNEFYTHTSATYADYTQVNGSCRPAAVDGFLSKVSICIGDVSCWMKSNRLSPKCDKTELLWCTSCWRQHQLPNKALLIDGTSVEPLKFARKCKQSDTNNHSAK